MLMNMIIGPIILGVVAVLVTVLYILNLFNDHHGAADDEDELSNNDMWVDVDGVI